MEKFDLIKACTDMGVHVNGTDLGPEVISNHLDKTLFYHIYSVQKKNVTKELEKENKKKNIYAVNALNEELFQTVLKSMEEGCTPLTLGGDHSLTIGSALASKQYYQNIGLIWFDAHADFNTFATTITGNIHGLPFATVTGQNGNQLTSFFKGSFYHPTKCVLIGARSIDQPGEWENLKRAGITIYTTKEIKEEGIDTICEKALNIVMDKTDGFHLSLDTDVMDPHVAPGVSVPEENGLSADEFLRAIQVFLTYRNKVKAIDLVEYNPEFDSENKTLAIIQNSIQTMLKS